MAKFMVELEETCVRRLFIEVEADNDDEAYEDVFNEWQSGGLDDDLSNAEHVDYETLLFVREIENNGEVAND